MTRLWPFSKLGSDEHREDPLAGVDLDALEVDDGDALGLAAGVGHLEDLRAEDAAAVGEEERPVVRVGDEQVLDRVLLDRPGPDDALAAARLAAVGGQRLALDVAAAGDGDHDVLVGDEVLVGQLAAGVVGHARPSLAGVLARELRRARP